MKYLLIASMLFLTSTTYFTNSLADSQDDYEDMCPTMPDGLTAGEPVLGDYPNYSAYSKAYKAYRLENKKHYDKYWADWAALEENYSPLRLRFYKTIGDDIDDWDLIDTIKDKCWADVMGTSEFWKDNACNNLDNPPTDTDWLSILSCVGDLADSIDIRLRVRED